MTLETLFISLFILFILRMKRKIAFIVEKKLAILLQSHVLFIRKQKKLSFLLDFQLNVPLIISAF